MGWVKKPCPKGNNELDYMRLLSHDGALLLLFCGALVI